MKLASNMTLHEYYAGIALNAFLRNETSMRKWKDCTWDEEEMCMDAIELAHSMLNALKEYGTM